MFVYLIISLFVSKHFSIVLEVRQAKLLMYLYIDQLFSQCMCSVQISLLRE